MPGRRLESFRSGDLNEELGILLLKGIAAVASVPRPEDFGIDVVANLLRRGPGGLLFAEDAFYVQFKSSSDRVLKYVDHEVRWLEGLKLPFFIGSVIKEKAAVELYATHNLSRALIEHSHKEIHLFLDGLGKDKTGTEVRSINIGPPLLSWSTAQLAEKDFPELAYSILKHYLIVEQRNVDHRNIRYIERIAWETNKPPSFEGSMWMQSSASDHDIMKVIESMGPHLHAVANRAFAKEERHVIEILLPLVNYLRECGVDLDPHRKYEVILDKWDEIHSSSGQA